MIQRDNMGRFKKTIVKRFTKVVEEDKPTPPEELALWTFKGHDLFKINPKRVQWDYYNPKEIKVVSYLINASGLASCSATCINNFYGSEKHLSTVPKEVWKLVSRNMKANTGVYGVMSAAQAKMYKVWLDFLKEDGWQINKFRGSHGDYIVSLMYLRDKKDY